MGVVRLPAGLDLSKDVPGQPVGPDSVRSRLRDRFYGAFVLTAGAIDAPPVDGVASSRSTEARPRLARGMTHSDDDSRRRGAVGGFPEGGFLRLSHASSGRRHRIFCPGNFL